MDRLATAFDGAGGVVGSMPGGNMYDRFSCGADTDEVERPAVLATMRAMVLAGELGDVGDCDDGGLNGDGVATEGVGAKEGEGDGSAGTSTGCWHCGHATGLPPMARLARNIARQRGQASTSNSSPPDCGALGALEGCHKGGGAADGSAGADGIGPRGGIVGGEFGGGTGPALGVAAGKNVGNCTCP